MRRRGSYCALRLRICAAVTTHFVVATTRFQRGVNSREGLQFGDALVISSFGQWVPCAAAVAFLQICARWGGFPHRRYGAMTSNSNIARADPVRHLKDTCRDVEIPSRKLQATSTCESSQVFGTLETKMLRLPTRKLAASSCGCDIARADDPRQHPIDRRIARSKTGRHRCVYGRAEVRRLARSLSSAS